MANEFTVYVVKNSCKCGDIYEILAVRPGKYAKEKCEDCGKRYRTGRGVDLDAVVIGAVKAVCDPYDDEVVPVKVTMEVLEEANDVQG